MYYLTEKSNNSKTGPIAVSTSTAETCPPSCPLAKGGCYAGQGPIAWHWKKVTSGNRGDKWPAFVARVKAIPRGKMFRHNQAGDLPGIGERINKRQLLQLARASKGLNAFTYTHKPPTEKNLAAIRAAADLGFVINLSANNPSDADKLAETGLPVAVVMPENMKRLERTPAGRKIVQCPAQYSDRTCANCGLCAIGDRGAIVGFAAHGASKKTAERVTQ